MDDRQRWDERYAGRRGRERRAPDPFVVECLEGLGAGAGRRAVDLAAGTGRHALELARRAWRTAAWDVSPVGLGLLADRAREAGLTVETRAVDLLATAPAGGFDLAVVVNFYQERLWHDLAAYLAPGGWVVAVACTLDWPGEKPPPRFRLHPGQLRGGLPGLETLRHREEGGRAGLFARRPESNPGDAPSRG